jgi:hypothetical protein
MKDEHYYNIFINVRKMILDAYTDIQIIESISLLAKKHKENNKKYKNNIVFILGHIMELAKKDLCLNVWKFAIEQGEEKNSLKSLRDYLAKMQSPIYIKLAKVGKNREEKIENFRNKILAHNLKREEVESIKLNDFKQIVDNAINDISQLCIKDIDERVVGISNADLGAIKISSYSAILEFMKDLE